MSRIDQTLGTKKAQAPRSGQGEGARPGGMPNGRRPIKTPIAKNGDKERLPLIPAPNAGAFEVFYLPDSDKFFARESRGDFQPIPLTYLKMILKRGGFSGNLFHSDGLSYLDTELLRITQEENVHYAGKLGGYGPGMTEIYASRVLVTIGPRPIEPREGPCPLLTNFFTELLGKNRNVFYAWLKLSLEALRAGRPWRPGQLLAMAGPPRCGKSIAQSFITPILGGRVSRPYKYMAKGTGFNGDIYGAEHGLIGDENHARDNNSRRNFGAAIKELVVEPCHYIRGLWATAVTLTPFIRLSLSLNDQPAALSVLPPLDSDIKDKLILLRAFMVDWPARIKRFGSISKWIAVAEEELPCFVHKLRRWPIPDSLAHPAYGVISYHDPELVSAVDELSDEDALLSLIDTYLFHEISSDHWDGTATKLEKDLAAAIGHNATLHMGKFVGRCKHLLPVLLVKHPERFERRIGHGKKMIYLVRKEAI